MQPSFLLQSLGIKCMLHYITVLLPEMLFYSCVLHPAPSRSTFRTASTCWSSYGSLFITLTETLSSYQGSYCRQVKSPSSQSLLPQKFVQLALLKSLVPGSPGEMLYVVIFLYSTAIIFYTVEVAASEYLSKCWRLPVFTCFATQETS